MDGGDESAAGLYRLLLDRFQSLEASHQKLQEQFQVLLQEKTSNVSTKTFQEKDVSSDSGDMASFPGTFFGGSPYRKVLEHMGHAVHVCRAGSGEIIYWNCAAEKLFGYKEYEVIGQRVVELLFDEEHYRSAWALLERLSIGKSWSGQLPLKKRSGQNFMAMVTKSPLYEDGELVGIVTVSSDAAVFNYSNWGNMRAHEDHSNGQSFRRINLKKIQWHPQPQIAAVPQLASSVSNLVLIIASKFLRKRGDISCNTCRPTTEGEEAEVERQDARADRPPRAPTAKPGFSLSAGKSKAESMSSEREESIFELAQASKFAVELFSKLQIGAISNLEKAVDENIQQNGSEDNSRKEAANEACCMRDSTESTSPICNLDANNYHAEDAHALERKQRGTHLNPSVTNDQLLRSSDEKESGANVPNIKSLDSEDVSPGQSDPHKIPSSGESFGSGHGSSSSRGENDSQLVVDIEIRWEDLQLREEVGQGKVEVACSFAVVYRGVWNGSDVAVKVYSGSQYSEQTLLDYKKEIDIMRRLRHPNVLLFMEQCAPRKKLAMGSLFKTLHRNNQSLDVKRRLKMAIDVARGMNYLHHRNPPIVHRDLKSSNLLVDKSWTVKPQWMAPEVLRNEPSTEK
ncbi:UNVERIFIED_CONTAM: putative serine/threonine-protein kinase SIS8 [Sesamum radiatum]|uniref:Serine/threonine-protein kinase SIS8 n=1 Tax=Sesamum radiatum TaxID=300843 RepID=A0AAW2L1G7_SESRA